MALNLLQNKLEANYEIGNTLDENIFVNPLANKDSQSKVNIYLQTELNNFTNLIAENIKSSSIDDDNNLESLEIISDKQYQIENEII